MSTPSVRFVGSVRETSLFLWVAKSIYETISRIGRVARNRLLREPLGADFIESWDEKTAKIIVSS